ncbi:MAG: hypothetical protein ACPL7B_10285, partial [Candidatus Poribacteria bacterium]
MNAKSEIIANIENLKKRINRYILFKKTSMSVFFGASLAVIFIIVSRFVFIPISTIPISITIINISVVIGIIMGFRSRSSLLETAIFADDKLKLNDRIVSAVELINGNARTSALADLQLEDTLKYVRLLDPKSIYPYAIPFFSKLLPVVTVSIFLAYLIPIQYGDSKEVKDIIRQVGVNIESSASEINKDILSEDTKKLIDNAIKVGRDLQNRTPTKKDALKNISQVSNQIDALNMINRVSKLLKEEITPEKKKLLSELLDILMDKIADVPEMNYLYKKIIEAKRSDLSEDAIKELIKAIETKEISTADANAIQKLSDQLAKGKQDLTQGALTAFRTSSAEGKTGMESSKGILGVGDGAPGKESSNETERELGKLIKNEGYEAEISGKISPKGAITKTEAEIEPEKTASVVPYENLYMKYKASADETIAKTTIPVM